MGCEVNRRGVRKRSIQLFVCQTRTGDTSTLLKLKFISTEKYRKKTGFGLHKYTIFGCSLFIHIILRRVEFSSGLPLNRTITPKNGMSRVL